VKENWRSIVSIVFAVVAFFILGPGAFGLAGMNLLGSVGITSGWAVGASIGAVTGAFNAAINGGNILQGALIGAVQGGVAGGILHGWEEAVGTAATGIEKAGAIAKHVVGHGVVGGAANEAMGGKFQDGFLSAAASAAAVHTGLTSTASGSTGEAIGMAGRTAASAIIGGTASALGGGKFANGAYTAAFQHLLNNEIDALKRAGGAVRGYFDASRGIIGLHNNTTGESIIRTGFLSGTREGFVNNPDMQHIKSPDGKSGPAGPLPIGEYRILYRPGGKGTGFWEKFQNIYKSTGEPGYRLEALDKNPHDDRVYAGKGVYRSAFRLHKNYGLGCITCPSENYRDIAFFIESSGRKGSSYGYISVF
jgi:hypothetical protein